MFQVARVVCCVVLLVLLSAAGCDEDPPRPGSPSTPTSSTTSDATDPATPTTPTTQATATTEATSSSVTPSATATDRVSGIATRTGVTITHDGQPIDAAALQTIGWIIDPATGEADWSDPSLGEISVTWEVPDERAVAFFDVSFWGEVTGQNLAMNPSMYTTVFTGGPIEATAHALGGVKAETPTQRLKVDVPEQPVGTVATVSINLGFPVPVLVTYSYSYL